MSPAYTAAQLNAYPGDNWITPGGDLKNSRYSTLTQITQANVGTLKEAWKISTGICPARDTTCGSNEANAVVVDGVYYLPTGKGHVFAYDAVTGKELWKYTPTFDGGVPGGGLATGPYNIGTGGRNSGVAVGEGKVFLGRRDGYLVALDQQTGAQIWKSEVIPWRKGGRLVAHPIYFDGIILIGTSGGDSYVRNDMQAFDATTGTQVWHWNIVPSPGQPGANSWAPGEYHYGGGAMWNSGAVDVKNRLVIIGTGNPVPWNSRGPGMNLWTSSLVALDVYTGVFKWGFQTVHHDNWDSDLPQSPLLVDEAYSLTTSKVVKVKVKVRVKGKLVTRTRNRTVKTTFKSNEAVSMLSKFGWNFLLDRKTGKPLVPTPEVRVPTMPNMPDVNAWPTQPIPAGMNILDFPAMPNGQGRLCANAQPTWQGNAPNGKPFKLGCMFDPYGTEEFVVVPFENVEWGPSAYNPTLHSIVGCAVGTRTRAFAQVPKASQTLVPGVSGVGVLGRTSPTTTHTGTLDGVRRPHEQADLASGVGRPVHQRVDQHRLEPDVRRHDRRRDGQGHPAGAQHGNRSAALGVAEDGRDGDCAADDLLGRREAVRLDLRRRTGPRRSDGRRLRAGSVRTWRLHLHLRTAVTDDPWWRPLGGRHHGLYI